MLRPLWIVVALLTCLSLVTGCRAEQSVEDEPVLALDTVCGEAREAGVACEFVEFETERFVASRGN